MNSVSLTAEIVAIFAGIITLIATLKSLYNGWIRDRVINAQQRKQRREEVDEKVDEIYDIVVQLEEEHDEFADEQRKLKQAVYFLALAEEDEVDSVSPERVRETLGVDKGLTRFTDDYPLDD